MHPTAELRDLKRRADTLEQQVAELSALVPTPAQPSGPMLPHGAEVHFDGFVVQGERRIGRVIDGKFIAFPSEAEQEAAHQSRIIALKRDREAAWAAEKAAEQANDGMWRDPCGVWRGKAGAALGPAANFAEA